MEKFLNKEIEFMVLECISVKVGKLDLWQITGSHIQTGTEFRATCSKQLEESSTNPQKMMLIQMQGIEGFTLTTAEKVKEMTERQQKQALNEAAGNTAKDEETLAFEALNYYSAEDRKLMKINGIIPEGTPDGQIAFFFKIAKLRRLNPLIKEIYLIKRNLWDKSANRYVDRYVITTSIDAMRRKAQESGEYLGFDVAFDGLSNREFIAESKAARAEAIATQPDGKKDYAAQRAAKASANQASVPYMFETTVRRMVNGHVALYTVPILSHEFMSDDNPMYGSIPFAMLRKVSEAHSLRAAFADVLGDVYVEEEFENTTIHKAALAASMPPTELRVMALPEATALVEACKTMQELRDLSTRLADMDDDFKANVLDAKLQELQTEAPVPPSEDAKGKANATK